MDNEAQKEILFDRWSQDPQVVLEHPDGRKVFPNGKIVLANGQETTLEQLKQAARQRA